MFHNIKYYTPSGRQKEIPLSEKNIQRYNEYVYKIRYRDEIYQKHLREVAHEKQKLKQMGPKGV